MAARALLRRAVFHRAFIDPVRQRGMIQRSIRLVRAVMLGLVLFFAAAQPVAAQSLLRDSETELLFKQISDPLIVAA